MARLYLLKPFQCSPQRLQWASSQLAGHRGSAVPLIASQYLVFMAPNQWACGNCTSLFGSSSLECNHCGDRKKYQHGLPRKQAESARPRQYPSTCPHLPAPIAHVKPATTAPWRQAPAAPVAPSKVAPLTKTAPTQPKATPAALVKAVEPEDPLLAANAKAMELKVATDAMHISYARKPMRYRPQPKQPKPPRKHRRRPRNCISS